MFVNEDSASVRAFRAGLGHSFDAVGARGAVLLWFASTQTAATGSHVRLAAPLLGEVLVVGTVESMASLYDFAFDLWHRGAEERCWENETWAGIERRRHDDDRFSTIFLSEERGLGLAEAAVQWEIFDRLNPRPWWLELAWVAKRAVELPEEALNEVRFAAQRARRGFSDRDLWDFDGYLSQVIAGGCKEIALRSYGHPGSITFDEWIAELNKIADGFDAGSKARDDFHLLTDAEIAELEVTFKRGWKLLKKRFRSLAC